MKRHWLLFTILFFPIFEIVFGTTTSRPVRSFLTISIPNELEKEYFNSFINKDVDVLIEEFKDGYYYGFTDNYIPVKLIGNYKINEIYTINLKKDNINFNLE